VTGEELPGGKKRKREEKKGGDVRPSGDVAM